MKRYGQTSPIAARQMMLAARHAYGFGAFGAATSSVYSGPPVGQGSGSGAATGAAQGASVGSVAGPIGIAIGAVAGAIGGAIAGAIGKKDPEQYNFDQAVAIYKQNPQAVLAIVNKYLPLAGMFDLKIKTNIPIYKKYGRMGEQRFLTDMAALIYNAAQQGKITAADTPQTIMTRIVQPWIDSWGFGPMADPNAGFVNMLLMGLIIDYVTGNQGNWLARGGDYPFGSLPKFALPSAAPAGGTPAGGTPSQNATTSSGAPVSTFTASAGSVLNGDSGDTMATPIGSVTATVGGDFVLNGHQIALTPKHTGGFGTQAVMWDGTRLIGKQSDGSYVALDPNSYSWSPYSAAGNAPAQSAAQVSQPQTVLTADGSSLQPGQNAAIRANTGETFYFGTTPTASGDYPIYLNGAPNGSAAAVVLGLLNGGTLYQQNAAGKWWQWANGTWVALQAAPVQQSGATTPSSTTVAIPAGYTVAATDAATGLPVYAGVNGYYYTWNGTTMTPYTGSLTGGVSVSNGVPQSAIPVPSLTTAGQQAYNTANPLPYGTSPDLSSLGVTTPTGSAAPVQPTAAGVSTSGSGTYFALGLGALAVIFATARPAKGGRYKRRGKK